MRAAISILRAAQIFLCSLSACNKAAFCCSTICYLHIFVFLGFVSRVGAVASYLYFFGKMPWVYGVHGIFLLIFGGPCGYIYRSYRLYAGSSVLSLRTA